MTGSDKTCFHYTLRLLEILGEILGLNLEKLGEILGVLDQLAAVFQDPEMDQIIARHAVLDEHLYTILHLLRAILADPVAVVTLDEVFEHAKPPAAIVRVCAHLDQRLHLLEIAPLGGEVKKCRQDIRGQLGKAAHMHLDIVADLQDLLGDIVGRVGSHGGC